MNLSLYNDAKKKFLSGDYSVKQFFQQNNFVLESGYCSLLSGDLESANLEFSKIENLDLRANWAKKLLQFINNDVINLPSYFQIRNFLEIDLNLLIQFNQAQFVENIINGADLFYSINQESYKFISRVMLNNDFTDIALYYLNKAKEKFYYDPEMHFMLANCYVKQKDKQNAKASIKSCLSILPGYFPATKLLEKINNL